MSRLRRKEELLRRDYEKALKILERIKRNEKLGKPHIKDKDDKYRFQKVVDKYLKHKKSKAKKELSIEGNRAERNSLEKLIESNFCMTLAFEVNGVLIPVPKENWHVINSNITRVVDNIGASSENTHFKLVGVYQGFLVINCYNQYLKRLLQRCISKISSIFEEKTLIVIRASQIPSIVKNISLMDLSQKEFMPQNTNDMRYSANDQQGFQLSVNYFDSEVDLMKNCNTLSERQSTGMARQHSEEKNYANEFSGTPFNHMQPYGSMWSSVSSNRYSREDFHENLGSHYSRWEESCYRGPEQIPDSGRSCDVNSGLRREAFKPNYSRTMGNESDDIFFERETHHIPKFPTNYERNENSLMYSQSHDLTSSGRGNRFGSTYSRTMDETSDDICFEHVTHQMPKFPTNYEQNQNSRMYNQRHKLASPDRRDSFCRNYSPTMYDASDDICLERAEHQMPKFTTNYERNQNSRMYNLNRELTSPDRRGDFQSKVQPMCKEFPQHFNTPTFPEIDGFGQGRNSFEDEPTTSLRKPLHEERVQTAVREFSKEKSFSDNVALKSTIPASYSQQKPTLVEDNTVPFPPNYKNPFRTKGGNEPTINEIAATKTSKITFSEGKMAPTKETVTKMPNHSTNALKRAKENISLVQLKRKADFLRKDNAASCSSSPNDSKDTSVTTPPSSSLQIAFIDRNHIDGNILPDVWLNIEKEFLIELAREMDQTNNTNIGMFGGSRWSYGNKIIQCENIESYNFVKRFITKCNTTLFPNSRYEGISINELPRRSISSV